MIEATKAEVAAGAALMAAKRTLFDASKRTRDAKAAVKVVELEIAAEAEKFRVAAALRKAEAMPTEEATSAPPVIATPPPAPQIAATA